MSRSVLAALVYGATLLASASLVSAQEKRTMIERGERIGPQTQPAGDNVAFFGAEMGFSFDGKVVKGLPFSGQAVSEMTQVLGDGNRIVNKSTASVYRDKEGRTRREQTIAAIGPFAGEMPELISINDPVAGLSYILEPASHTARKMAMAQFEFKLQTNDGKALRLEREKLPEDLPGVPGVQVGAPGSPAPGLTMEFHTQNGNGKEESLGKQSIEGVEAEGTRTTVTSPAGEIGNERAIEIISERWYSPELQTVVMTKHSDPRFGETVYRLTNISRADPDASLFQVPSGYKIKDAPLPLMPLSIRVPKDQ